MTISKISDVFSPQEFKFAVENFNREIEKIQKALSEFPPEIVLAHYEEDIIRVKKEFQIIETSKKDKEKNKIVLRDAISGKLRLSDLSTMQQQEIVQKVSELAASGNPEANAALIRFGVQSQIFIVGQNQEVLQNQEEILEGIQGIKFFLGQKEKENKIRQIIGDNEPEILQEISEEFKKIGFFDSRKKEKKERAEFHARDYAQKIATLLYEKKINVFSYEYARNYFNKNLK